MLKHPARHIITLSTVTEVGSAVRFLSARFLSALAEPPGPHVTTNIDDSKSASPFGSSSSSPISSNQQPLVPSHTRPVAGSYLRKYCRDLTADAAAGLLDPLIGREDVLSRSLQILLRRTKNNPILIGDPGVGKTAIAEGIAQMTASPHAPPALKGRSVVSLDLGSLIGGTQYRGAFEERLQGILSDMRVAGGRVFLFVDEVHMLVDAGRVEGGTNAADLLKPALARGELRLIGATTVEEYRKHIEGDAAFARRMQPVMVEEPEPEVARVWLEGLKPKFEEYHGVRFGGDAVQTAIDAAQRFAPDRRLPDSAIDLLDEAASLVQLQQSITNLFPVPLLSSEPLDTSSAQNPTNSTHTATASSTSTNVTSRQKWRWWLESVSQGRSPEEINNLLQWFGASPSQPLPGFAGHKQTADARKAEFERQNNGSNSTTTPLGTLAGSETRNNRPAGLQAAIPIEESSTGRREVQITSLPCPHCGTATPAVRDATTVNCPNCKFTFLNIPPEKLMLGASLFLEQQRERQRELELHQQGKIPASSSTTEDVQGIVSNGDLEDGDAASSTLFADIPVVTGKDILQVAAAAAGIPLENAMLSRNKSLLHLEDSLCKSVCGQRSAVHAVVNAVKLGCTLSGKRRKRPMASLLLTGPSGVGKSTLCRALAEALFATDRALVRIDLSRCSDRTAVSRLVGAAAGYIGYGDGGELTDAVRRRPHSVVLFEAADKAHPEVLALVTEILQHGELRDSMGRVANFHNAVVVLTANRRLVDETQALSSSPLSSSATGTIPSGNSESVTEGKLDPHPGVSNPLQSHKSGQVAAAAAAATTSPEGESGRQDLVPRGMPVYPLPEDLLSAVDAVVPFSALSDADLEMIAVKAVEDSSASLLDLGGGAVTATPAALAWLLNKAQTGSGSAHRLQGLVRTHVLGPAVDALINQQQEQQLVDENERVNHRPIMELLVDVSSGNQGLTIQSV